MVVVVVMVMMVTSYSGSGWGGLTAEKQREGRKRQRKMRTGETIKRIITIGRLGHEAWYLNDGLSFFSRPDKTRQD